MQLISKIKIYITAIFTIFILSDSKLYSQNKTVEKVGIKKLQFLREGYASQSDYEIVIYGDRTVILHAISDNYAKNIEDDFIPYGTNDKGENIRNTELKGIFKAKLKKKQFEELNGLIRDLNNQYSKKVYHSKTLHNSISKLKITYTNNLTLSIYDNGLSGSEVLIKLYNILNKIKFDTHWE